MRASIGAAAAAAAAAWSAAADVPAEIAHILPGPAYVPFYRHAMRASVARIAFLDSASNQFGARSLAEWTRRQADYADMAGQPPPLPATATQVQCCIFPLYAVALARPRARDYQKDREMLRAEFESLGFPEGEYAQITYGEHVELGDLPLRARGVDTRADALAAAFGAAGLAAPAESDHDHVLALMCAGPLPNPGARWTLSEDVALKPFERVLCVREIPLHEGAAQGGTPRSAIVVGTGFHTFRGEDYRARGRILIFRVVAAEVSAGGAAAESAAEGGAASAAAAAVAQGSRRSVSLPKLKLVFEEELRANITCLAGITVKETWTGFGSSYAAAAAQGVALAPGSRVARHIVVGAGRRLQVHEWREGRLRLIAIFDAFSYVKDLSVVNDLIFFGDALGCARLVKWRDEDHQLIELGLDPMRLPLVATGLVVDEGALGLVVADAEGNVQVEVCSPAEHKRRLQLRADFHLGAVAAARLVRVRCAFPVGTPPADRRRFASFVATRDGSVGALVPADEMVFKRLNDLQKILTYCMPHAAGLNPRLWRLFASAHSPAGGSAGRRRAKNVLDGCLLARFLALSTHTQRAFAEAIGSSEERVLANLRAADLAVTCW